MTNHFTPRLAGGFDASRRYPVISATALAGVPDFVASSYGERTLERAIREMMVDPQLLTDPDCYIPHAVMARLAAAIERTAREKDFGLALAPQLSVRNYGCWGEYVLGADTLGGAIDRGVRAARFHASGDVFTCQVSGGVARIIYTSAAKGRDGYAHVASGIIAILLSICREYLPARWRPLWVELDIPAPRRAWPYEEAFGALTKFDAAAPAICVAAEDLLAKRASGPPRHVVTIEDVARARSELGIPDFSSIVAEQVRLQMLAGSISIDRVACVLDSSVRSLQRELNRCGTSFRDITAAVRVRRAANLLAYSDIPVTQISNDLGYSAPAHFARAFRRAMGQTPREYRSSRRQGVLLRDANPNARGRDLG
jgi:AraC-like DNA-binding protein